ncbi:MAG: discoidin domain-containing protein [Coprobacter fastidiosus]
MIDGDLKPWNISSKWCNIANESWAIIDLEGLYNIYKFKTYDCKHNESGANFNNYRVYVSTDKVNWTLVLDETGVGNETIKEDYIAPTKARYCEI